MTKTSSQSFSDLARALPQIEKALAKSGFKLSLIEKSEESASYAIQGMDHEKTYLQVLSIMQHRPEFAIVELYVSNLSVTEKWSDIEISFDILPEYLKNMLSLAGEELNKFVTSDQKLEAIVSAIEEKEPKLAALIKELHNLEDHLEPKHLDAKARQKFEMQIAKIENQCLKQEMEISRLAFRYFTNTIDPVDPYFFSALSTANWLQAPAKKKAKAKAVSSKK